MNHWLTSHLRTPLDPLFLSLFCFSVSLQTVWLFCQLTIQKYKFWLVFFFFLYFHLSKKTSASQQCRWCVSFALTAWSLAQARTSLFNAFSCILLFAAGIWVIKKSIHSVIVSYEYSQKQKLSSDICNMYIYKSTMQYVSAEAEADSTINNKQTVHKLLAAWISNVHCIAVCFLFFFHSCILYVPYAANSNSNPVVQDMFASFVYLKLLSCFT